MCQRDSHHSLQAKICFPQTLNNVSYSKSSCRHITKKKKSLNFGSLLRVGFIFTGNMAYESSSGELVVHDLVAQCLC